MNESLIEANYAEVWKDLLNFYHFLVFIKELMLLFHSINVEL